MPIFTTRYSFPSPQGTDSNNPPADIRALAVAVEARLGVVDDAASTTPTAWAPAAWSGAGATSGWTATGGFTGGEFLVDGHHRLNGTGMVDLGDNGPTFNTAGAPAYVSVPVAPVGIQSGQDVGGWVWADSSGNPLQCGRLAWNASVNKAALAGTASGYAQIPTSYRFRLSYSLSYRVA